MSQTPAPSSLPAEGPARPAEAVEPRAKAAPTPAQPPEAGSGIAGRGRRLRVVHRTGFVYSQQVSIGHNAAWLTPLVHGWQQRITWQMDVCPEPARLTTRQDYFGNTVSYFSVEQPHTQFSVTASGEVLLGEPDWPEPLTTPAWEAVREQVHTDRSGPTLQAAEFLYISPMVEEFSELEAYARESFAPARPILDAALDLTLRIGADFAYAPQATTIATPLREVFEGRRGVCQDFAHLQIGCLRSLGLPARYVSGYLLTHPPPGKPRLIGADASHAWVQVFCGPAGWVDLDPTNRRLVGPDYITLAVGRDYGDVSPIRGVINGGGRHSMSVSVDVAPVA